MLDLIFSGLATIVGEALDGLIKLFMPLLDFDFDTFNSTFPYAADVYTIIQSIAMAIVLLIAAVQIIPFFWGGKRQNESPFRILISSAIAVGAIFYGNYIFAAIMEFAQQPFDTLRISNASASLEWNLSSVISSAVYQVSILLYIVLIVAIGIAFVKLMLEIIERYVFLFVMVYLSPLASATLASKETSGIFLKFVSMFISQCALFVLNIWFLKMVVSMFQNLASSPILLLGLLMGYAMLRIAAKLDSYMNQLGLNAAAVGMGNELLAAGMIAMNMGGKAINKSGAGADNKGGVLGIVDKISNGYGKISPVAGISQGINNGIGGLWRSGQQALGAAMDAANGETGIFNKGAAAIEAGSKSFGESLSPNMHDAWMKTQGGSLWARGYAGMRGEQPGWDDISKNGFVADSVIRGFENAQGNCASEGSEDISALCQGIGLNNVDENAQEMLDVGYGNVVADNMAYKIDGDGMQAQYEKDGWAHNWQVKTATQYGKLSPHEQQSYTAFKSSDGKQYYYSHNKTRAESPMMKAQTSSMEQIRKFGMNPMRETLDSDAIAMLRKEPSMVHNLYQNMGNNEVPLDASTPEGRRAMGDMLTITPVSGSALTGKKAAMDALAGGATITESSCNASGMDLSWQDNKGDAYTFSVKTPVSTEGATALLQNGYTSFAMGNGSYGWAKYTTPPTPKENAADKAIRFASSPSTTSLSIGDCQTIFRDPGMTHSVFMGMAQNGGKIHIEPGENSPHKEYAAGMISNLRMEGIPASERNAAAMAIMAGQARFDQDGRGFSVEYNAGEHEGRHISMLTPSAVKGTNAPKVDGEKYDFDHLANRKYSINTINGDNFYSLYETQLPPVKKSNRSTNDHY